MLFQYSHEDTVLSLAYLQYYQYLHQDDDTGMLIVQRTDKYEVISVGSIARNVHMIPLFDSCTTATDSHLDVYSYSIYLVNHFSDRAAFRDFNDFN
jgi:hypothetical protein